MGARCYMIFACTIHIINNMLSAVQLHQVKHGGGRCGDSWIQ
jgi:hypothetical protein